MATFITNRFLVLILLSFFFLNTLAAKHFDTKIDSLLIELKNVKSDTTKANILNNLSWEYKLSIPEKANEYAKQALDISNKTGYKKGIAKSLNNFGIVHCIQGNYSKAIEYFQKALKLMTELGNESGISSSLNNIGIVYDEQANYPQAIEYYQKSLKINKKKENKKGISACLNNIGLVYEKQGNYTLALEYFQDALKIEKECRDKRGISNCMINIGEVYKQQGNYTLALEYYQEALKIGKEFRFKRGISNCINNIGEVYKQQGNYTLALEYYQEALKIGKEFRFKRGISNCINNIGEVYKQQGNYTLALEYYKKSLTIYKELGKKSGIANNLNNIGNLYYKLKKFNIATEYSLKSLKEAKDIGAKQLIANAYRSLSENYSAQNSYKKAFKYHKLYKEMNDSIFNKEKSKQLNEMQVRYETEKKEQQIQVLKKENEINVLKLKKHKIQRNLLIVSSLFILLSIIILYSRFLLKKKTNEQLEIAIKKISKSEAELKESNNAKDKFFTIISHDLKGPFNSLLGFSELLIKKAKEYDKEKIIKFGNAINTSAHDLYDLTENLLLWGNAQSGNLQNIPEKVNLRKLVIDNISVLKSSAEKKNIILYQEIPENIYVYVDINIISMVIRNLISNALKFTNSGGKISVISVEKDNLVEISVIDTGIGISEESIKKLFRIDIHYTTKGTSDENGTGLGLILCKEFVGKSGGGIWVESEPDKGSTFKFTLPKIF
ncbi:MAG: tetratricopeptide repeat-containing sensor histidine kinase [Bacteroidales bacterium]|nr:tetratricopeptide repeat-containing sensor histidine kinase [Bacteroidales bacterium]